MTLRPPRESDLPRFVEWLSDREVTRFLGQGARAFALVQEEEWHKRVGESKDDVVWAIAIEDDRTIGVIGIHRIDWIHAHAITGILIGDKKEWRKGYATEAMALRTDYAFAQLNLHKLSTQVFMDNEASRHALRRSGYRQIGTQREELWQGGRWHDAWLAEVLRADWERAKASR